MPSKTVYFNDIQYARLHDVALANGKSDADLIILVTQVVISKGGMGMIKVPERHIVLVNAKSD